MFDHDTDPIPLEDLVIYDGEEVIFDGSDPSRRAKQEALKDGRRAASAVEEDTGRGVTSVRVSGCDRLSALVVECRVRIEAEGVMEFGPGYDNSEPALTCITPRRVPMSASGNVRVTQPAPSSCHPTGS